MKERLEYIQVLRGLFLILPVFHHLTANMNKLGILIALNTLQDQLLHRSVDVFFFISGFIITYIQKENYNPIKFLYKRLKRILPLYYIVSYIIFLVYLYNPLLFNNSTGNKTDILSSFLLIQARNGYAPLLNVSWSLYYEVIFYCLFSIGIFIFRKKFIYFFVCIILLILFYFLKFKSFIILSNRSIDLCYIYEFCVGVLYCKYYKEKSIENLLLILMSLLIFSYVNFYLSILMIFSILILILFDILNDLYRMPKFLITLGDFSYYQYILHVPVMFCFRTLIQSLHLNSQTYYFKIFSVLILFFGSYICSFAIYHYKYISQSLITISKNKRLKNLTFKNDNK